MIELIESTEESPIEIVRLVSSCWSDKRGIHQRRSLLSVRRKSKGHQLLEEDSKMIGADEVILNIVNFKDCPDGLYLVTTCNEQRDWESGMIDSYDYKLVPFVEEP